MKYEFDEKRHRHLLDGKSLTGCTTILSVIAKPALIQWAANMTADFIKTFILASENQTFEGKELFPVLEDARKAHCKRKETAGDKGKEVHDLINKEIQNAIDNTKGIMLEKWKEQYDSKSIINFIDWAIKNKIKFLETEKNIYSEKLWIGGIVDFVCEIDGQVWIGDIKTSGSGIYPEHFWQCAGYHLMLQEMKLYENIAGYLILNLKESGEILEKRSISNDDNVKAFLACLDIYRIQEKIKNQIL